MTKVGYVYDPIYLKHDTGSHPENASRLEAIVAMLEKSGLKERLTHIPAHPALVEELLQVHDKKLVAMIQAVAESGGGWLDPDTFVSPGSYTAALYAAGGVINAVDAVMQGEVSSAFALVRPPGHHATPSRAMGFCLFNNIAIATKYALSQYQLERAAIIDFDVHHGNGTQEAFYDDPHVLYVSAHQYPHYPGTGRAEETGQGEGKGTNINIPMPAGYGDAEYRQVFEQIVVPALIRFRPELILVSAGYDNHRDDPLAMMAVTTAGFARMTAIIKRLAEELCGGRLVLTLEGGYNLEALSDAVKATFNVMLGDEIRRSMEESAPKYRPQDIAPLINKIKQIHSLG
jgi:acetoin utilization deacetylase AcuC-like enzyme